MKDDEEHLYKNGRDHHRADPGTDGGRGRVPDAQGASPAEKSGIRAGDVILSVNGFPVSDSEELEKAVRYAFGVEPYPEDYSSNK